MKIDNKKLIINYSLQGTEGSLESPIYLINNDIIVGKTIEDGCNMGITGFKTENEIKLIKLPEIFDFAPVYWEGIKSNDHFKGNFGFFELLPAHAQAMYSSIEKTFMNLETKLKNIDETTQNMINILKKQPYETPNTGNGLIYLK